MTRICSYCKAEIGEKCGQCGSLEVLRLISVPAADLDLWGCMQCGNSWIGGSDGATHTICDSCFPSISAEISTPPEKNHGRSNPSSH